MTPAVVALDDVFIALRKASDEGGCWKLIETHGLMTCHEACVPQGSKCVLCELWGAWETYEEIRRTQEGKATK